MLHELQAAFGAELVRDVPDERDRNPRTLGGAELIAADRFWIYRNNFLASLAGALAASFPAVERLVGKDNFRFAANGFARAHPPSEPSLYAYGDRFPGFLATLGPAVAEFPFLPDLARLEWAVDEAYFAADGARLTPEALAALDPAAYAGLRLSLHPSARLVESRWPIWDLWDAEAVPDPLGAGPHHVLVLRRPEATGGPAAAGKVDVVLVSPGDFAFLRALAGGARLQEAAAAGAEAEPAFDLTAALGAHLERGSLAALPADRASTRANPNSIDP